MALGRDVQLRLKVANIHAPRRESGRRALWPYPLGSPRGER